MAIWGALGAAAGSLLGSSSAQGQTRDSAKFNMAWQEGMYNTRYQRTMADMRKAGLNPMLAYEQGGGSVPGGASASFQDAVTPGVSSAMQAIRTKKDLEIAEATIDNLRKTGDNIVADTSFKRSNDLLNKQLWNKVYSETKGQDISNVLTSMTYNRAKNLSDAESGKFGETMPYVERILNSLGVGAGTVRKLSK